MPDRPGIVHAVSGYLVEHGANIVESQQFGDRLTEPLLHADRLHHRRPRPTPLACARRSPTVAERFGMALRAVGGATRRYRTLIMVSKHLHCLNDLLFRASTGALQIEIPAVVSNHPDAGPLVRSYGIDFHHVPVTPDDQVRRRGAAAWSSSTRPARDLVVLARYMQVLSDDLCRQLSGRAINIHHSFLPSFKGARPYHQAFDRGVKLVGATAHYVTADLDEGPIIEQDVLRVDHGYDQDQLVAAGRDVEAQVLSRAVRWHAQSRVLLNGDRTVVFR